VALRQRHWQLALVIYWILLFIATHYPRVVIPGELPHSDKLVHFGAFGGLALLFWFAVRPRVLVAAAILIPYAAFDEWLQQFVGRFTDLMDFVANTIGIVVVLGALALHRRYRR
jgi:VanZ family protein